MKLLDDLVVVDSATLTSILKRHTENIFKGQTEIREVVLEWIMETCHGNVTISNLIVLEIRKISNW